MPGHTRRHRLVVCACAYMRRRAAMRPRSMQRKAMQSNGAETSARIGQNVDIALSRKAFSTTATSLATPRRTWPPGERGIHFQA
eukprot:6878731-Pyramimonas_sp.AAC.1